MANCPFCGGEADEYEGEYGNGIYCMECGAMVGEPIHQGFNIAERVSYEQAAKAWNTRAERTCFADEVTHRDCKYSVNRGWRERTCKVNMEQHNHYGYQTQIDDYSFSLSCGHVVTWDNLPDYCPYCGAKVVE